MSKTPPTVVSLVDRLGANAEYRAKVAEVRQRVVELDELLFGAAVQLAMTGPWRAWSDAQPDHTIVDIDERDLREAGDARIVAMLDLAHELGSFVERLDAVRG